MSKRCQNLDFCLNNPFNKLQMHITVTKIANEMTTTERQIPFDTKLANQIAKNRCAAQLRQPFENESCRSDTTNSTRHSNAPITDTVSVSLMTHIHTHTRLHVDEHIEVSALRCMHTENTHTLQLFHTHTVSLLVSLSRTPNPPAPQGLKFMCEINRERDRQRENTWGNAGGW